MDTKITSDVLESFVHCPFKAHLELVGEQGHPSVYEIVHTDARHRIRYEVYPIL
jgi:hypothetical protein